MKELLLGILAFVTLSSPRILPAGENSRSGICRVMRLSDGRKLSYAEYGPPGGKLVFYFHGIPASRVEPTLITDEIWKSGIRMVAPDRPGMGQSTPCPDRTILDWADDVAELADALGCRDRKFGILAVSGGASYGCACAIRIPCRISHLALVSPYGPAGEPEIEPGILDTKIRLVASAPRLAEFALNQSARQLPKRPARVVRQFTRNWLPADKEMVTSPGNYEKLIQNLETTYAQGAAGTVTDITLLHRDWGFAVREVRLGSVSIWGGQDDPIATPSMPVYFHRQIKGSHLILGPGEGHVTMVKHYAGRILREFH